MCESVDKNFFNEWINNFPCQDEVAACLIHGMEPQRYLSADMCQSDMQKIESLVRLLKSRFNSRVELNIFFHINTVLENGFNLPNMLIEGLKKYHSKLLPTDSEKFCKRYSYIARELGIFSEKDYGVIEPDHPLFSSEFDIAKQIQRKGVNQGKSPMEMKSFVEKELKDNYPKHLSSEAIKRISILLNPDSTKSGGRKKHIQEV